jgi:hypothetical protein
MSVYPSFCLAIPGWSSPICSCVTFAFDLSISGEGTPASKMGLARSAGLV